MTQSYHDNPQMSSAEAHFVQQNVNNFDGHTPTFDPYAHAEETVVERPAVTVAPEATPVKQLPVVKRWSVSELYSTQFPDPYFAIPGLLPAGLSFLIARPKIGKSWLALQIAVAISSGGKAFDQSVKRGRVLYLALEDGPRRMRDRLKKQCAPLNCDLTIMHKWPLLTRGGSAELQNDIDANQYSLVIVDTMARAVGDADLLDQGRMNTLLAPLQEFSLDRNVALMFVHHKRKGGGGGGGGSDVIDDVLGATAIAGVGDAYFGIDRKRGERTATLQVTGREIDEREIAIEFDSTLGCWHTLGSADGVRADTVQAAIVSAITEHGGSATTVEIARWLGKHPENVTREMAELLAKNVVVRGPKRGRHIPYQLVDHRTDDSRDSRS